MIPCFNEEKRLPVAEFETFYAARPEISYCFIDDGSSDNTLPLLRSLAKDRGDRISVVSLPVNVGKAEAVRAGVLHALRGQDVDYVGYFDADLATPLNELDRFISWSIAFPSSAIVFGSRIDRPEAHIIRSPLRYYLGRAFAAASNLLLGIPAYDTQCGAKLIRASVAGEIFHEPFISRWLFDVELFLRAAIMKEGGPKSFIEVPLNTWTEKGSSRIGIGEAVWIFVDSILIWERYRKKGKREKGRLAVLRVK